MQKTTTSLSLISILIILISQAVARQTPAGLEQISDLDAALALGLIFCAAGVLASWLVRPLPQQQDEEDPLPAKKSEKKDRPH